MKFNIHSTVLNRQENEIGKLTGGTRKCQMTGCTGVCYGVRWYSDNKLTYPCSKGLKVIDENTIKLN
jgi:hypothetical protein